jgi:oligosaccharide repeat unit polymerase
MFGESIVLIILFTLMIIGFWLVKHSIFSPWNVTLSVWTVVLILYVSVDHGLYNITSQMIYGLLLWVIPYSLSSFTFYNLCPSNKSPEWAPCEKNIDFLTIIAFIISPYGLLKAIQHAMQMASPEGIFHTLREQAVHPELYEIGPAKYFIYVAFVLFVIEANRPKIRKLRFTFTILLCLMYFFLLLSKQALFIFILGGLYILYTNKKITLKPFLVFFGSFLFFAVLLEILRGGGEEKFDSDSILWFLAVYIVSPMEAFCTDMANSSIQFGEYTLKPIYNFLNILGFNVHVPPLLDQFVSVPLPTNVYTTLSPIFRDFGYKGLLIISTLEGAILGCIYKFAVTGNTILKYIYSFLLTYIFLQFFDELIFRGITQIAYVVIIVFFCHIKFTIKKK